MADAARLPSQSVRFLLLYALAAAGGAVAYVPLLTVLLPVRVGEMAGAQYVTWLAYLTFCGAIAASLSNIAFGWLSDLTGNRKGWILAGLAGSSILLIAISHASSFPALLILIVGWQVTLNMMLAPLSAWAGDCVPDHQKGFLGGLLAFSPALGALCGSLVTVQGLASADMRLVIVAVIVAAMVLPVMLFERPIAIPKLTEPVEVRDPGEISHFQSRRVVASMWVARLLLQISEAALFSFLFFWFRSISPTFRDSDAATVFSIALCIAVPIALASGRWSDRHDRPILPMIISVALSATGLGVMAMSQALTGAIGGYLIFGIATTVFLALHAGQTLRVLPRPQHRGRDLGLFNLTNTVPSLIMPWLALGLVPNFGFSALLALLGGLALISFILLISTLYRR